MVVNSNNYEIVIVNINSNVINTIQYWLIPVTRIMWKYDNDNDDDNDNNSNDDN